MSANATAETQEKELDFLKLRIGKDNAQQFVVKERDDIKTKLEQQNQELEQLKRELTTVK